MASESLTRLLGKTRLCKFYGQGRCKRGSRCTFAHSAAELQAQPDLFRSQLCVEFTVSGECRYGPGCRFAHGTEQLRLPSAAEQLPELCDEEESGEESAEGEQRYLRRQLDKVWQRNQALQAKLKVIEESRFAAWAPESQPWASEGYWGPPVVWAPVSPKSMLSTDDEGLEVGSWGSMEDTSAWAMCADGGLGGWHIIGPYAVAAFAPKPGTSDGAVEVKEEVVGAKPGTEHPPAAASEPRLIVRNTFIDFDQAPATGARRRAASAPGRGSVREPPPAPAV